MKQKKFEEIYDNVYASVGWIMKEYKKYNFEKEIKTFLVTDCVMAPIVFFVLTKVTESYPSIKLFLITFIIYCLFANLITYLSIRDSYKDVFKKNIIDELVKQSNKNLKYNYKSGMPEKEYKESKFDNFWSVYYTEDLIEGEIEDGVTLKMAQVHTLKKEGSGDDSRYVTTFYGIYGIITLKTSTNLNFIIQGNSKSLKFDNDRIEMESAEFEKYYDVFADSNEPLSKQKALEILTMEAIEKFVEIRNIFKKSISIRICDDKIYFRINIRRCF